jgi:hypothetical protein
MSSSSAYTAEIVHEAGVKRAREEDDSSPIDFDLIQSMRLKALASIRMARGAVAEAPVAVVDNGATVAVASESSDDDNDNDNDDDEDDEYEDEDEEGSILEGPAVRDSSTWQPPPCRWGNRCREDGCTFLHASATGITSTDIPVTRIEASCRYGNECRSLKCPFTHKMSEKQRTELRRKKLYISSTPRVQELLLTGGGLVKSLCKRYKKKYKESMPKTRLRKILLQIAKIKLIDALGREVWERR